jgi:hypothetical protein
LEQWVVTYRFYSTNCCSIMEFFRGSEFECRCIEEQFAGGSCDLEQTHQWDVFVGPAKDWDHLIYEQEQEAFEDEQ